MATSLTQPVTSPDASESRSLSPSQLFEITRAREEALSRLLMAFVTTGLIFMVFPGTFLGVWNLLQISGRESVASVSSTWFQAHGHAQVVEDLLRGATAGEISQRFHDGLVATLAAIARILRERTSLNTICLSGGTFQNACLANGLEHQLQSEGFKVYTHSQVPAGDGGISLGQAVVAAHRAGSEDLSFHRDIQAMRPGIQVFGRND